MWTENILKTEVFENDDVLIIMWLTLFLKGALEPFYRRWLLRFQISPAKYGRGLNCLWTNQMRVDNQCLCPE